MQIIQAKYVVPCTGDVFNDGAVAVEDDRIVAVGPLDKVCRQVNSNRVRDLGDVAILPAPINAHTHLEFSDLTGPLGQPGIEFTSWIREVMRDRAQRRDRSAATTEEHSRQSISRGLHLLQKSGTTAVGEIATQLLRFEGTLETPVLVSFYELIGISADRIENAKQQASAWFSANPADQMENQHRFGLSPHAPYSCHVELVQWACKQSARHHFPVAMHLAETRAELELLATATGPFHEMLEEFGFWNKPAFASPRSPIDYLQVLAQADRALIVHGNYLNNSELEFIAEHHDRMSIVFCPRTHDYFRHEDYPLSQILEKGIPVALGTDSLASNPDLNVWNEAAFVAHAFPQLDPQTILNMITTSAAQSLGLSQTHGSIEPGKLARMVTIDIPENSWNLDNLFDHLWQSQPQPLDWRK
jgi:cytosine/adenosine deaminase-related metal-dependent hydrolase